MRDLSLRFYELDYLFLKQQSRENGWSIARSIVIVCQVHELFHLYFTITQNALANRVSNPVAKDAKGKILTINYRFQGHNAVDWLRCLIADERNIMGNEDSQSEILHHLIQQYAYFQVHKPDIILWYRSNKPECLTAFQRNGYHTESTHIH